MSYVTDERASMNAVLSGLNAATLAVVLDSAQSIAEKFCERTFESAVATEVYDGDGQIDLFLRNIPVVSLTSITVTDASGKVTVHVTAKFLVDLKTGIIRWNPANTGQDRLSVFPSGFQNLSVVYVSGFATVPADVISGTVAIAAWLAGSEQRAQNIAENKLGDFSAKFVQSLGPTTFGKLPTIALAMLRPYRALRAMA